MSKSYDNEGQDVSEFLRHLQNVDTSGGKALMSFYQYLMCNWRNIGSFASRIENTLLNYLNPRNSSCSSQKNVHLHFSAEEITKQRKLDLLAACFSLVPILGKSQTRGTRFVDFQLHIIHDLCITMITLLEYHGVTHTSLSSLLNHLTHNSKSFSGLSSLNSQEMSSPEFVDLLFVRIQFFISSLRHLFELGDDVDNYFCLPAIVSFFNGVFSSKLTDSKRSSNRLLLISSQLMLALSSLCRSAGVNLAPAGPCLLTILIYQLEWSQDWFSETKFCESLIRLRLAILSSIKDSLAFVITFSRMCFFRLLPRFLQQVVGDLMRSSELRFDSLNLNAAELSVLPEKKFQSANIHYDMKQKVLMCNLVLVERLFEHQSLKELGTTIHHCSYASAEVIKDDSDLSNSIQREFSRLELCVQHLLDDIIGKLPCGYKSSINHRCSPLLHPQVLLLFARAASSMASTSKSPSFRKKVDVYLSGLAHHPDTNVSLTASKCNRRGLINVELSPSFPPFDHNPSPHSDVSKNYNNIANFELNMAESRDPIADSLTSNNVSKRAKTSEFDLKETTDSLASRTKQPRLLVDMDQDSHISNSTVVINSSTVDNFLTDFDPTFA